MSYKSVPHECSTRVSHRSVPQECPTRVSHKSVPQECPIRVSHKSVLQECPTRVAYKSDPQECATRVSYRVSRKSVLQECPLDIFVFRSCLHSGSWVPSCFLLGSKNNRNCPPLSALSIHHDTPRLHQQAFLPPMARTHANALATEVMQHRMAQRHHLSKALVVSLLKNHYSNEGFCRGKGRPFDLELFCFFDTNLIMDLYKILLIYFLVLKLFPGDLFWAPRFQGPPIRKNATEVSLFGGGGRFLLGGLD